MYVKGHVAPDIWDYYVYETISKHLASIIYLVNFEITFPGALGLWETNDHAWKGKFVILNPCMPPIGCPVVKEMYLENEETEWAVEGIPCLGLWVHALASRWCYVTLG